MSSTSLDYSTWDSRADRWASTLWLGVLMLGMIAGFGADLMRFLAEKPPAPTIVHVHALVFVSWLGFLIRQVWLVRQGRPAAHRRAGLIGLGLAGVMLPLGLITALVVQKQHAADRDADPAFLATNLVDVGGFVVLTMAGFLWRRDPAAHRRLMILATTAMADPGYSRLYSAFFPSPASPAFWGLSVFYGNFIVIGGMAIWDLARHRRLHPALIIGGGGLSAALATATALEFAPAWKALCIRIIAAWPWAG